MYGQGKAVPPTNSRLRAIPDSLEAIGFGVDEKRMIKVRSVTTMKPTGLQRILIHFVYPVHGLLVRDV
jgi:hypothetical protein